MGKEDQVTYLFTLKCDCGFPINIPNPDKVGINLVGLLQFTCPKCGIIINLSHNPLLTKVEKPLETIGDSDLNDLDGNTFKSVCQ